MKSMCVKRSTQYCRVTVASLVLCIVAPAQPRILPPILAVDNPALFDSLFIHQQQFESTLVGDGTKSASAKDTERNRFAKSVGLAGLPEYTILHQSAIKMIADAASSSARTPLKARQEARERATEQLRKTLPYASYNKLRAYLLSTFINMPGSTR